MKNSPARSPSRPHFLDTPGFVPRIWRFRNREVAANVAPVDRQSATEEPPTMTVVIPCFNHGEFLPAAVASAGDCEGAAPELLIVNDGSIDPFTIDVLERLRAAGYRVLDQPNRGLSAARNEGIRAARGRYILPLDADNRIRSSYLRRAAEILDAAPEVGVVYGDASLSGGRSGVWRMPDFDLDEMATGNRIDACGVFRREVWLQCGGYDEGVALGWEDWDFWLSAAEKGWRFVHVPEVLFDYRLPSQSTSASGARQQYRRPMLELIIAKHPAIFQSRLPKMFAEKDGHWLQAEARAALLERDRDEVTGSIETTRRNLQGARDDLHATRRELAAARSEAAAARSEAAAARGAVVAAQGELAAAHGELLGWRERVGFMTGTRAWRLRASLPRLRRARSASLNRRGPESSEELLTLNTELARHALRFRPGTSDLNVFHQIFVEREYSCLDDLQDVNLILDCGANVGYSAAYLLSRFPAGHVVSIEPDPGNFEILRANLAPYGDSATLLRSAVWSHPTGLMLSTVPYRDGREWARQVRECKPGEEPDLFAVDVESVLRQFPGERVSILKMDIEGAEGVVFGANDHPWIDLVDNIVIELHDDSVFGNCTAAFMAAISGRGFSLARHGELTVCIRR